MKDIVAGGASSNPFSLYNVTGVLYFNASDPTHETELWRSDGSATGTYRLTDIFPGVGSSSPSMLTHINGTLFFAAEDPAHGRELWKWVIA